MRPIAVHLKPAHFDHATLRGAPARTALVPSNDRMVRTARHRRCVELAIQLVVDVDRIVRPVRSGGLDGTRNVEVAGVDREGCFGEPWDNSNEVIERSCERE